MDGVSAGPRKGGPPLGLPLPGQGRAAGAAAATRLATWFFRQTQQSPLTPTPTLQRKSEQMAWTEDNAEEMLMLLTTHC